MKEFTLTFEGSSVAATAVLMEQDAPRTCNAFWKALPVKLEAVHSSWSGECIIIVPCGVETEKDYLPENQTIYIGPGEIALYTPVQELLVFYGRGQPRWRNGPCPSTVFARITDGLDAFSQMCRKLPKEGAKRLLIRKKE